MRKTFTFFFVVNQTIDQPKVLISGNKNCSVPPKNKQFLGKYRKWSRHKKKHAFKGWGYGA